VRTRMFCFCLINHFPAKRGAATLFFL
jgi:hypothetical protein